MDKKRSHQKKELYKLIIARADINAALKSCELLIGRKIEEDLYSSLFNAMVVCY
jgi:hypothetical protein